jgi:hypothetical protein
MKPGDRFVWYGKKETVIGTVYQITERTKYDLFNGIKIVKRYIVDLNGIKYDYNQCYQVENTIRKAFLKRIISVFSKQPI